MSAADDKRFHDHCLEQIAMTVVMTLGEALNADPQTASAMLLGQFACNEALALNPWIPTIKNADGSGIVSPLNLLDAMIRKLSQHALVPKLEAAQREDGTVYVKIVGLDLQPLQI